jgi:hypothetical protein
MGFRRIASGAALACEKLLREFGWLPNAVTAAESWREEFTALRHQRLSGRR